MAEDEARLAKFVEEAKAIADQKKVVSDQDLETLLGVYMDQVCERERGGRGVV